MDDNESVTTVVTHPNWGAIWAGVFTFLGIWTVFGLLGTAIFASAANPNVARPVGGMNVGIAVWSVVLTIISLYFAGRVTGHLAGIGNTRDGVTHGMIMFGLSMVSAFVIIGLATASLGGAPAGAIGVTHSAYVLNVFSGLGWAGFIATFLGWLAAMGGAATGTHTIIATRVNEAETQARRAA